MQISSRAVMFWGCRWATQTFNYLERFSMGLRSGDWLGHSRTLKCFLRSHSFVAPGGCVWDHCHAERPRHVSSSMPLLMEGGFHSKSHDTWPHSFFPLHRSVVLVPLQKNSPQSMTFPPPCFTVGMVFFGCNSAFFLLQTRQVEFLPKSSILVSSDHMTFSQSSSGSSNCSLANFRRAWTYWLKQGDTSGTAGFESWRRSVLLMLAFVTLVPALCRSFTRSPCVVLGFLLTVLVIIWPHGCEILHGSPRSREIISGLVCLPFSNNAPTVISSHQAAYLLQIQSSQPGAGLQFVFWCPLTALWSWP